MKPTPFQVIIFGLMVVVCAVCCLVAILTLSPPGRMTPFQIMCVGGPASSAGEVNTGDGRKTLEIWVSSLPVPFRCYGGPYPESFDQNVLSQLAAGKNVKIGILPSEFRSPSTDRTRGQIFYPMVSLEIEGQPALTLEATNRWQRKNMQTGLVMASVLAMTGGGFLWAGVAARRRSRSTG